MCLNAIWIPASESRMLVGRNGSMGRYVPCGHCVECLRTRQNNWFVRFWCEDKYQKTLSPENLTLFLTLTYDENNLPQSRSVAFNDFRAFIKKFRRKVSSDVRYYAVTEHGTQNGRLHFHCLLFGVPRSRLYPADLLSKVANPPLSNEIAKYWKKGFNCTKVAGGKDFRYVSKYITKDIDVCARDDDFDNIQCCSKRPSIGSGFFTQQHSAYYNMNIDDLQLSVNYYKYSLPRYIREKVLSDVNLFFSKTRGSCAAPDDSTRQKDVQTKRNMRTTVGFKKYQNIKRRENG